MKKTLRSQEIPVEVVDLLKPYLIDEVSATEFYFADKSGLPAATVETFTATAGQTAFTVAMRLDVRDVAGSGLVVTVQGSAVTPTVTGLHTFTIPACSLNDAVVVTSNQTSEQIKIVHQKKTGTVWRTKVATEYWENRTAGTYLPING